MKKTGLTNNWNAYGNLIKPLLDRLVAVIILILLSPLILITALLIYVQMGKPILFAQKRPGKDAQLFTCYKFRTMTNAYDINGQLLPDAERLTQLGKVLRKTSLDELPQLWSVLKGDMSFIGPRPLLIQYLPYYSYEENKRHDVLPGITGLAQVCGRNKLMWEDRFKLDIEYVENQSFMLDFYILGMTLWKVIARSDIDVVTQLEDFDKYRQQQIELENYRY